MNFFPKLGTISSMIHLEEGTCVPLWFSSLLFPGEGLGCAGMGGLWPQPRVQSRLGGDLSYQVWSCWQGRGLWWREGLQETRGHMERETV